MFGTRRREPGGRPESRPPGQPEQSLLLKALRYKDPHLKMPPTGKLPDHVIADFEKWIADGAADSRTTEPAETTTKQEGPGTPITEHPAPETSEPDWPRKKSTRSS